LVFTTSTCVPSVEMVSMAEKEEPSQALRVSM
jgi:hypothetical protein